MDSMIGLLFVLIPLIFTLIGKKLEKAGKESADEVGEAPSMPEAFPSLEKFAPEREAERALKPEAEPEPMPKQKPSHTQSASQSPKQKEKSEKIDPKKLVIYSEIMKPKF